MLPEPTLGYGWIDVSQKHPAFKKRRMFRFCTFWRQGSTFFDGYLKRLKMPSILPFPEKNIPAASSLADSAGQKIKLSPGREKTGSGGALRRFVKIGVVHQ